MSSLSGEARAAFASALSGSIDHVGCAESARADVESRLGVDQVRTAAEGLGDVLQDERVIDADEVWSNCAAGFGITASSILELTDNLAREFAALPDEGPARESFRTKEIAIATELFDCTAARNAVVQEVQRERLESQLSGS